MKWLNLFLIYIMSSLSLPCLAETPSNTAQESTQEINTLSTIKKLRAEGNYLKARSFADDYLKQHPKDYDVKYLLALTYLDEKNKEAAYPLLSEIIIAYPKYTEVRVSLINLDLNTGRTDEAKKLLNEGLQLDPNNKDLKSIQDKLKPHVIVIEKKPAHKKIEPTKHKVFTPSPLKQIRLLMQNNQNETAKAIAVSYLKDHPNDVDVKLFLGLIYLRENDYKNAEYELNAVLTKVPTYMDARIALIRTKLELSRQEQSQAIYLYRGGLTQNENNTDLRNLRHLFNWYDKSHIYDYPELVDTANQMVASKRLEEARQLYTILLKRNPTDMDVLLALANVDFELGYDKTALNLLRDGLKQDPNNLNILLKQAEIEATVRQYALAFADYQKVLNMNPEQKVAKDAYQALLESSPRYSYGLNEIGFFTDNAWVQDLHEIWDYSMLYYARDTNSGRVVLKVNYASRQGIKAPQYEIDYSPRINRNVYLDLAAAVAKQPAIFPDYMLAGEVYWNFPQYVELSGGAKRSQIESTYFSTDTISITRYQGQNMFTFRPYHFIPKGNKNISNLFTGTARHYFTTDDHYISMTVGTGHSPDLADLLTVDFLVITNNFITLSYETPLINHRLTLDVGVGYQRWGYPSGLVRNLYDGSIGLKCRF